MGAVAAACALVAVVCASVMVGVDIAVALVLHRVLDKMSPEDADALAGRLLHESERLRVFPLTAVVAAGGLMVAVRAGTPAGVLAMAGLAFLLLQLLLTIKVKGPQNPSNPAGGRGDPTEHRHLQASDDRLLRARWESVMGLRAAAGAVAMTCLMLALVVYGGLL